MISVLSMDEQEVVVRDLRTLVRLGPVLSEMVVPSPGASGSNAGVCASVPGPRSPVREHPFQVKLDAGVVLRQVIRAVCARSMARGPRRPEAGPTPLEDLAGWLIEHVDLLAEHEDAADAVVVIGQQARRVADLVDPPLPAAAPTPGIAGPRGYGGDAPGEDTAPGPATPPPPGAGQWGNPSQVSQGAAIYGCPVSRKTVREWAKAGHVRSIEIGEETRYSLEDVVAHARGTEERVAESRRVV